MKEEGRRGNEIITQMFVSFYTIIHQYILDQTAAGEPSLLCDQTCEWGHAHTALSQTVSSCPSHGSFCGGSHTES